MKRLSIQAAKDVSKKYKQNQVILVTWDAEDGTVHIVTYGRTLKDCDQAAQGGNVIKYALGFSDVNCNAVPARIKKKMEKRQQSSRSIVDHWLCQKCDQQVKIEDVSYVKIHNDCGGSYI